MYILLFILRLPALRLLLTAIFKILQQTADHFKRKAYPLSSAWPGSAGMSSIEDLSSSGWVLLKRFFFASSCCNPSSETQGQIKGARESLNGRKNIYGTKKSKERREQPLGTMSYQTSSKRSVWLLIGARKLVFFLHQSEARKPERKTDVLD